MLNTETCFDSRDFISFCQEVECACEKYFTDEYQSPNFCFDDGGDLDTILELYNNKCPIPDAINEMVEYIESGYIDAYLNTPPWDR